MNGLTVIRLAVVVAFVIVENYFVFVARLSMP
jgi:hypothetical protein